MAEEAAEKTEEPTSKKLEDARKEGNVPKSQDTSTFITLIISLAVLWVTFSFILGKISDYYQYSVSFYGQDINMENIGEIIITSAREFVLILLPLFIPIVIAGVLANVAQFGFNFTVKPLTPKFEKINPIKGLKNMLSLQKLVDGIKMTFKALLTLGISFYLFFLFSDELKEVVLFNYFDQLDWLKDKAIFLTSVILALFLVFAGIDFAWTRYNYKKKLRMTKQQVKDELKNLDGNPEIKQRIRKIQMESARKRMLSDVKSADVVVTNPTHFSVALRYDETKEDAPRVVAKGVDVLAFKIREIAEKEGIPIIQKPPLARELHKVVEVGQMIPANLFRAVVEVFILIKKSNNS